MSLAPKTVIAILGTTGVGKTKLSIELATKLRTEIINFDAMQMYRGFDIITNKATREERELVPHHLIDFANIDSEYTIKDFEVDALDRINKLHSKGSIPILVGGTHYYLQSLLWNSSLIPSANALKEIGQGSPTQESLTKLSELQKSWDQLGNSELHAELSEVDPKMAEHWHVNDRRKVLRSLQVFYETGKLQSDWILERQGKDDKSLRFNTIFFWLYANSAQLNPRLDSRVDDMIKRGLFSEFNEIRNSLDKLPGGREDYDRGIKQAIGFKAFDPYFQKLESPDIAPELLEKIKNESLEVMKQQTRRYAKKQVYWIKNQLLPLYFSSPQFGEETNGDEKRTKLYLLDASDLSCWDSAIRDEALSIIDGITNKDVCPDPRALGDVASKMLKPPEVKADFEPTILKWRKRICEECSRRIDRKTKRLVEPVIVNGDLEWEAHVKSKGHRKQVEFNRHKALVAQPPPPPAEI